MASMHSVEEKKRILSEEPQHRFFFLLLVNNSDSSAVHVPMIHFYRFSNGVYGTMEL